MEKKRTSRIFNIPNLLSFFRLCLIPLFVAIYREGHSILACAVLLLSGLTDIADGRIARKFNMVTELGKALDPVADKCTQIVVAFCLCRTHPHMSVLVLLLLVKETVSGITEMIVLRKTRQVNGAVWHGKLTTVLFYAVMSIHLVWPEIPRSLSDCMIILCLSVMILSFILYLIMHIRSIRSAEKTDSISAKTSD